MSGQDTTLPRKQRAMALPKELGLRVLSSPDTSAQGRVRRVPNRGLSLGRGDASDGDNWSFDDPMASRAHATIGFDETRSQFVISDAESRNGTQLNGEDVGRELLRAGDIVRIGDTVLSVEQLDPALSAEWGSPAASLLRGSSPALQRVAREIARAAPTDLSLLIEGETGSGKDVVAREIHRASERDGKYVAINCAAIVESLVESELFGHRKGAFSGATGDRVGVLQQADGGTLLLDEIGELPGPSQAKLLRVLEDKLVRPVGAQDSVQVDTRFVFATNRSLAAEVDAGRFRADLYARIAQLHLKLPPLRQRPADLLPIAAERLDGRSISADAFEAMALHPWPFNVRELFTVIDRALLRVSPGEAIELHHIEGDISVPDERRHEEGEAASALPPPGQEPTKAELIALLQHTSGKVADAARHLGKGRTQLYRWLTKHAIDPSDYR